MIWLLLIGAALLTWRVTPSSNVEVPGDWVPPWVVAALLAVCVVGFGMMLQPHAR